ncbi:MAG: PAS domain S-box protein [Bacteroidota bacterium]|nr:PAS domain S-box protein [Bacteroidota bacterium]
MDRFLKILHLEDSETDSEIVLHLLKKEGFHFESQLVMTRQSFLDALQNFKPDIIISDNSLPQFNAREALEIVNENFRGIPFILVTGTVSEEFAATIIKLGADDYILKDRLARLPAAIETALLKKESEAALRQHEDEINFKSSLLATVGQAVIATDLEGKIIYWNHAAETIYGWNTDEVMGLNIVNVAPASQSKEQSVKLMEELKKGNSWSGEFLVKKRDGSLFPVFVTDSPIHDSGGKLMGIIGVSNDISEQKKAEEAMKKMEMEMLNQKIQEQKKISRAIIKAQEEQRNHIGKELHDNINQILAGTKLYLNVAAKKNETVKDLVKYPIELIDNSIKEIRALTSRHVVPLKNIDLKKLIGSLTDNLNNAAIKSSFLYDVSSDFADDELKLNVFRIAQEVINNIIKHSRASNVTISMYEKGNVVSVEIKDDGKGFNLDATRNGIGISNMMDRTESFNGKMSIETSPGNGCKTTITLPAEKTYYAGLKGKTKAS